MTERPLRVAVDARCLNTPHLRGMGKSVFELVRRTTAVGSVEWHLFSDRPDLPVHSPSPRAEFRLFELHGNRFHAWEQVGLPFMTRRVKADVMYAPATVAPWWQPVPTAVTIHDTIPWADTGANPESQPYRDRLLPAAYARASAVITISGCSRRDILSRWPHLAGRMHVVPPGVDERYLDAVPDGAPLILDDRMLDEPYLLYFGGADRRKRLDWALEVWRAVAATGVSLVVSGLENTAHDRVRQSIPRELADRLILAPFVPESLMPRLYMRAAAVLYPSLYEGFGLPALEAQAVGTPVLFSDVGGLSELKGPGARVLPVNDLDAWIVGVSESLRRRAANPQPEASPRQWARQFSWDVYAQRTVAVYRSIAAPGRRDVRFSKGTLDEVAP